MLAISNYYSEMKVGERKILKYSIIAAVWLMLLLAFPTGSYLNKVLLSVPSYFAVLFGSYAFLKIGHRLASIPEFAGEQEKLLEEIKIAREFYKKKGLDVEKF